MIEKFISWCSWIIIRLKTLVLSNVTCGHWVFWVFQPSQSFLSVMPASGWNFCCFTRSTESCQSCCGSWQPYSRLYEGDHPGWACLLGCLLVADSRASMGLRNRLWRQVYQLCPRAFGQQLRICFNAWALWAIWRLRFDRLGRTLVQPTRD